MPFMADLRKKVPSACKKTGTPEYISVKAYQIMNEFEKFASMDRGISPVTLGRYNAAVNSYINPTVIEERRMNVASMDVFSRLLMDRIIFLGVPIDDDVANIIQAQLLFLSSLDSKADISMYLNTPGGQVSSGLAIYDTMQLVAPDVSTICTGMAASMGAVLLCAGEKGRRCLPATSCGISSRFRLLSPSPGQVAHALLTRPPLSHRFN